MDAIDSVTLDVPLLIRLLEHAREDIKSDADLHRVVERVIEQSKGSVRILGMDQYNAIAGTPELARLKAVARIQETSATLSAAERKELRKLLGPGPSSAERGNVYMAFSKGTAAFERVLGLLTEKYGKPKELPHGGYTFTTPSKVVLRLNRPMNDTQNNFLTYAY